MPNRKERNMKSKLIGKTVSIKAEDGKVYGDWGIVVDYDGDSYYVAFAGDNNSVMVFNRNEIVAHRK